MNKAMKGTIWTMAGVIGAGSIGVASFYIFKYVTRYQRMDLGPKYEHNGKDVAGGGVNLVWYANEDGSQFMTKEEYKKLDEYLATHLYFGPEIDSFYRIVFGDRNIIGGDEAGLYFPVTREMFINTAMYVGISKSTTFEQKRDSVFEVIAHEYGHHFAHTYMKDYKSNRGVATTNITPYEGQLGTTWNKNYLDDFTDLTGLTGKYGEIKDPNSKAINRSGKEMYNINATASLNQLYKYSNDKNYGSPLNSNKNYYFGTSADDFPHSNMPTVEGEDDIQSLQYYYSTDEQYTRLMEQAMLPKNYQRDGITFLPQNVIGDARSLWGTVAYDTAHSKSLYASAQNNFNLIYPSNVFGGYMNDTANTQIVNYAKDLYDSYLKSMGFGYQLANLYSQNDRYIIGKTPSGSYEYSHGTVEEIKNIKLSGYTTKDWDYIAIYDSNNKKVIQNIPITSKEFRNNGASNTQNEVFNFYGRDNRNIKYNDIGNDLHKDFLKPYDAFTSDPKIKTGDKKFSYISNQFVNFEKFKGNQYQIWFNDKSNISPSDIPSGDGDGTTVMKLTEIFNNEVTNYEEGLKPDANYYFMTIDPTNGFTVGNDY